MPQQNWREEVRKLYYQLERVEESVPDIYEDNVGFMADLTKFKTQLRSEFGIKEG